MSTVYCPASSIESSTWSITVNAFKLSLSGRNTWNKKKLYYELWYYDNLSKVLDGYCLLYISTYNCMTSNYAYSPLELYFLVS